MLKGLAEFKFFQSFRVPVESKDDIRFLVEQADGHSKMNYISDALLIDASVTGMGISTKERFSTGQSLRISIQFKKIQLDVEGTIVRSFTDTRDVDRVIYGVELDTDDHPAMKRFIEAYIGSFGPERAKDCLAKLALSERYANAVEGMEMFSLLVSLFKDMTGFGNKEDLVKSMLEEAARIINGQKATLFLINPETNELEAYATLGLDKSSLKFDYRAGIAGQVFTSGAVLNIEISAETMSYGVELEKLTGIKVKSLICSPIHNKDDKIIGAIEVLNKKSESRFTLEDEKVMKVIGLVFSSVFYNFNPISDQSLIRRFSTPHDRELALIGKSTSITEMRRAIVKMKDSDIPLLIEGEIGTGKTHLAKIIHSEGKRGLNPFIVLSCVGRDVADLERDIFGNGGTKGKLDEAGSGTIVFHEICFMPLSLQQKLLTVLTSSKYSGLRTIFTASKDLQRQVEEDGSFNKELYEYMSQAQVVVPSLRKRKEDIAELVGYFLRRECKKQGVLQKNLSPEVMQTLCDYEWPGNVAELKAVIGKAVLYNTKSHVINEIEGLAMPILDKARRGLLGMFENMPYVSDYAIPLKDRVALVEKEMIMAEIKRNNGNKSKAAKLMGISREALRKKLIAAEDVLAELQGGPTKPKTESDADVISQDNVIQLPQKKVA